MQSLERESFKHRIDQIISQKEIVAIIGTMELHYQKIPFIPAMNLFKKDKIIEFQDLLGSTLTVSEMSESLMQYFSPQFDVKELFFLIDDVLQAIRKKQELIIENTVLQALNLHIAFLVERIKKNETRPPFENVTAYHQQHYKLFEHVATQLAVLEKKYAFKFSEDDIAYIVKTLEDNQIELGLHSV